MNNPNKEIAILLAFHIIAGLVLTIAAKHLVHPLPRGCFEGLVCSQLCLLGIWGGLGTNRWQFRLLGVIVAHVYLFVSIWIGIGQPLLRMVTVIVGPTICVALILLVIRRTLASLQRVGDEQNSVNQKRLQFSIRQLMILTFMVAIVVSGAQWLDSSLPSLGFSASALDFVVISISFTLAAAPIGFASLWAMLAKRSPLFRCVLVFLLAATMGSLLGFVSGFTFWRMISVMMAEAMFMLASLWVVRRCGFRLVRLSRVHSKPEIGETPTN